jgi:membrane-associated protease RseP (regulator of RpoE activity)
LADSLPPSDAPPPLARISEPREDEDSRLRFAAPQPPRDRVWLHILLLILTFGATTLVGMEMYAGFLSDFGFRRVRVDSWHLLLGGLSYSIPALLILGSHEMGHYIACRIYGINASLPYFIPAPQLSLFGTLGAVIRIREPLRSKRMLFDVGVAGPIAGFVVLLPALVCGLAWSRVVRQPPVTGGGYELGEPFLFQLVSRWFFGTIPEGYALNAHPMAFAAIFGLLATALNLLPLGQLDGGHLAYANLGPRARFLTFGTLAATLVLGVFVAPSWLFWCVLMVILLQVSGWQHPQVVDEDQPLDSTRVMITIVAIIIFALCFTPAPITPQELIRK